METIDQTMFVYQTDSETVKTVFEQKKNFLIEYSKHVNLENKQCAIYFSSNNIYYPNTEETFQKQIIYKDKYEWYETRINNTAKHIFIRDIKKQWYLGGINSNLDSIEKLADFLKNETQGYSITTVGSSAGGFAAVLFGSLLHADKIYTFNGQFELFSLLKTSSAAIDPTIFREQNNVSINKYYSLVPYIKKGESVFYFCSLKSDWDARQLKHVEGLPVNSVIFNTAHHGIPFLKTSLLSILNMDKRRLETFVHNKHHPLVFSFKIEGIKALTNAIRIYWKKKTTK